MKLVIAIILLILIHVLSLSNLVHVWLPCEVHVDRSTVEIVEVS
jgi:hypothetical protein